MNKKIFMSLIFFLSLQVLAQGPDILWTKTFGGTEKDGGHSVYQTSDGGYIIAGYTEPFGAGDFKLSLIKTDSLGNVSWDKTLGDLGTFSYPQSYPQFSATQTIDGGYIICGYKASSAPEGYGWLIKTDVNGDTLWTKEFAAYPGCRLYSVKETTDSGYVATGYRSEGSLGGLENIFLVKTNSSGNLLWTKTYGSSLGDFGHCVETTLDGGYVVVGTLSYNFDANIVLLKTDFFGDTVWTKLFGGAQSDMGYAVQKTDDGGYVLIGSTYSFGISKRIWLLKTNAFGDTLWTRTYGGYGDYDGYSVQQSCDGGFIIIGEYYYPTGGIDLIILKADENGNQVWYKNLGSGIGRSIRQTTNFGYILVGSIYNDPPKDDVWLIKTKPITVTEPNGWEIYSVGDTVNIYWISECATDISIKLSINNGLNWNTIIDSTANIGIFSWVVYSSDSSDQCLIKISSLADSSIYDISNNAFTIGLVSSVEDDNSDDYPKEYILDQNFPNPFNPSTKISWHLPEASNLTLQIFNALGEEVSTLINNQYQNAGEHSSLFIVNSSLPSGVYFYQLKTDNYIETKKMILMR
jgi:hypothetical protein